MSGPPQGPVAVEAIVLSTTNYGEANRIVRMLSADYGRIDAAARHARGSKRRFGGALDAGNRIRATLRRGQGDLWTLQDAALVHGRDHARHSLVVLTTLLYLGEVCASLARQDEPEPKLFGLLDVGGLVLDAATAPPTRAFRLGFEAKALTFSGLAPALVRCVGCGEPVHDPVVWDGTAGGALHVACAAGVPSHDVSGRKPATAAWFRAVEHARRTPLRELVDAPVPDGPHWALSEAIASHGGRALRSRAVLAPLETG